MKLSGYFVLAAVAVSVVFAKESDNLRNETITIIQNCTNQNLDANVFPNATLALGDALQSITNIIFDSEDRIMGALLQAKLLVPEHTIDASHLLRQGFVETQLMLIRPGSPSLLALGEALALSNEGARKGLAAACNISQIGGFALLSRLNLAQNLLLQGLAASGGNASLALIEAGQSAIYTGYASIASKIQIAVQTATQALRDAKNNPLPEPTKSPECKSAVAQDDAVASDAIEDISEGEDKSLQRGANADVVKKLGDVLKCAVSSFANLANKAIVAANNLTELAENDPFAMQIAYVKLVNAAQNQIHSIVANIYFALGEAEIKSCNQTSSCMSEAVTSVVAGEYEVVFGLISDKQLVSLGIGNPGDSPALILDATAKVAIYCKVALIKAIVNSAKLAFNVL